MHQHLLIAFAAAIHILGPATTYILIHIQYEFVHTELYIEKSYVHFSESVLFRAFRNLGI